MILYLTSSPTEFYTGKLLPDNGLIEQLSVHPGKGAKLVFITSSPDDYPRSEEYMDNFAKAFEEVGLGFSKATLLDRRNAQDAEKLIMDADMLFLSGGHVPTENAFFHDIGLKDILTRYDGVVMGCSAGTMNSADNAYQMPEMPGETAPDFQRFLPGLGLTWRMVVPHYYYTRESKVDGLMAMEEIAFPDSMGRTFTVMPDGTYLYCENGSWQLRGEAWELTDGVMHKLQENGEVLELGADR